ncbi:MAG: alpha-amylase family glycosyl hydrolase [Acutalibacteraceae bacterium]|nr:alpha-amylase family glycosyl hydrolase [Acutalibacteraceae bacterium]
MNEKKSFSKKLVAIALTATMLSTMTAAVATTNVSAVTTNAAASKAVQPTDGDPSTFSWDNATVYFALTDRFSNGNTSNDHAYGRATDANGNPLSGWSSAPGTFHGGDFAGMTKKIEEGYFDNLGVNAIWITAPYEQMHGYCSSGDPTGNFAHYAYHGYYVADYTETDANLGTKAEFKKLVDTAHEHGIRIVMDIVMNHTGYNNLLDMKEFGYGTLKSGYESYLYKLTDVGGMHNYIDYNSSASDWGKWWGSNWIRSGLPGYSEGGGDLTGSLSGLPDLKTESTASVGIPEVLKTKWTKEGTYSAKVAKYGASGTVSDYLVKWLAEWVETYGVDGFRCDTAKHVDMGSWKKLKTACTQALKTWKANNPTKKMDDLDFWMTGECWGHQLGKSDYFTSGGFDSMINFAFGKQCAGNSMPGAGSINGTYSNYANSLNNDDNYNVLTYVSSHDDGLSRGNSIYTGSALLLMPGGVQIFYGDETDRPMLASNLADHAYRSDMNWNSVNSSATLKHWQKVGQFRNNHIAVGAGSHTATSASSGTAFIREYSKGNITDAVAAVIGASANTNVSVTVGSIFSDGTMVTNAYDGSTATVSGGKVSFNSGAHGTILIEGPQSNVGVSLTSSTGSTSFEGTATITVNIKGATTATVKIDNGAPFTVQNGGTFTIGANTPEGGQVTVTVTATDGTDTANKTVVYNKKDPNATVNLYFDNSAYKWSSVNAYIYDESGSSVIEIAKWPGKAMTLNPTTGLYEIEVPENLLGAEARVIFNENSSSANRYPAEMQPGLSINGASHKFGSGNSWTEWKPVVVNPTDPPTENPYTTVTLGDMTGDGKITVADVILVQRGVIHSVKFNQTQLLTADVDGNSKVALADCILLLRKVVGYSDSYSIGKAVQVEKDKKITI